jgi:small-conductance mechanosensitive channel
MPDGNLATTTGEWIGAGLPVVIAFAAAFLVDRAFQRRGRKLADSVIRGGISREADTRLRFVRRLVYTSIIVIGVAVGLSQFDGINKVAGSILASGAIAAAIVGFAAQRTLANFVAGVMLAISQPLRVGDWVSFEDHYGVVEDVRLNFTILRTPGEQRIVIPNEKLASGVLRNETLKVDLIGVDVAVWLPRGADAERAIRMLEEETGGTVAVAEITVDGVRLSVGGERVAPEDKAATEAELRLRCLQRLQAEGLLGQAPEPAEGS